MSLEKKGKYENNSDYFDKFKATVDAFEHHCGKLGNEATLIKHLTNGDDPDNSKGITISGTGDEVREWYSKTAKCKLKFQAES